ncbi:hypothetical protein DFH07DRAFT_304931 [Mycena maculata]|uniref:C2H2-type domain-containing protein n=1 Tax=Mycena maculata TaxID=230809 RepID=A0AAD7HI26_9AGAR|nr:hypothetical protein DFH07DRAFT_304931 [Mycena maculata]
MCTRRRRWAVGYFSDSNGIFLQFLLFPNINFFRIALTHLCVRRKHTGERPFACHCAKQFSRLDNLRQHAQTVHSAPEDKPRNEAMMRALASINASMMAGVRGASRRRFSPASAPSYSPGSSASPLPSPGLASSYPHPSHYPPHAYAQQQHGYVSPPGSGYAEYAPNGAQSGEQGYFGYTASPLGSPCAASFPPAAGPPPYNVDLEQLEGLERICGEESHQQREVQVEQERVRVKEEVREDEGLGLAGFYAALHAHPQEAPLSRYASSGSLRSEHSAHAHAQQQQHPAYAFAPHPHPHPASNAHNAHPPASAPNVYPGSSGGSAHSSPAASPSAANFWGGEAPPRPQLAGYPTVTGNEGSGRGKGSPRPGTDPNPSAGNFWGGEAPPVVQRQQQQQEYPHHAHAQGQGQGTEYLPSPPQSPAYSAHSGSSGSGSGSGSQSSGYGGEGAYTWAGAGAGAEEGMGVGEGEMSNAEYYAALQAEGYYAAAGQQGQQQQQHVY